MKEVLKGLFAILVGLVFGSILIYLLGVYVPSPVIPKKQVIAHKGDYFTFNGEESDLDINAGSRNFFVMSIEISNKLDYVSSKFKEESRVPPGWKGSFYQIADYWYWTQLDNTPVIRLERAKGNVYVRLSPGMAYVEVEHHHLLIRGIWRIITVLGFFISYFPIYWGANHILDRIKMKE